MSASGKNTSPARPVSTKTTTNATNQRTACRTSRKTRAPSGARMPHKADTSRGKEPADQHLPGRRRQQDVKELRDQEWLEAPGSREDRQRTDRDGEVDERHDPDQRAEREVETFPTRRTPGRIRMASSDEEHLLLAQLLVVLRIGADPSGPPRCVADPTHSRKGGIREGRGRVSRVAHGRIFTCPTRRGKRRIRFPSEHLLHSRVSIVVARASRDVHSREASDVLLRETPQRPPPVKTYAD